MTHLIIKDTQVTHHTFLDTMFQPQMDNLHVTFSNFFSLHSHVLDMSSKNHEHSEEDRSQKEGQGSVEPPIE